MTKNQKKAIKLIDRIWKTNWRPTTVDMIRYFGVSEESMQSIKSYARVIAFERGVVFGYDPDPQFKHFRVVSRNDVVAVKRIVTYYLTQWRHAGQTAKDVVAAGNRIGIVPDQAKEAVAELYDLFDAPLTRIEEAIK